MKIKSMLSAGEVFVTARGDIDLVPMQLFRSNNGGTILRMGGNTYFFTKDGRYDGSEHKGRPGMNPEQVGQALLQAKKNRGRSPAEAYFQSGSPGFMAEVRSWPSEGEEPEDDSGEAEVYGVAYPKKDPN